MILSNLKDEFEDPQTLGQGRSANPRVENRRGRLQNLRGFIDVVLLD